MTMSPASKRALDLDIFKHSRWFVNRMLRNPSHFDRADFGLDDCKRPRVRNPGLRDDSRVFPRRGQELQRVWLFMKGKHALRRCLDEALFDELHLCNTGCQPVFSAAQTGAACDTSTSDIDQTSREFVARHQPGDAARASHDLRADNAPKSSRCRVA